MKPLKSKDVLEAWCDGDIWNYRIGFSVQHKPPQPPAPWFTVKWAIDEAIDKVKRKYPNAKVIITLTDEHNNYRSGLSVTRKYKGGRVSVKPYYWRKIRDHLEAMDCTIVSQNEEADDLMSKALASGRKVVCVSEDKDLKNTSGLHFNDKTGRELWVTVPMARRNFYTQCLVGDTVDNIQGCPSVGKAKAVKLLEGVEAIEDYECIVGFQYAIAKLRGTTIDDPEARLIEMARLLHMRTKDGEMWNLKANGGFTYEKD